MLFPALNLRSVIQDRNRVVLTMDDLSLALGEHGVNVKKPDYCEFWQYYPGGIAARRRVITKGTKC